MTTLNIELSEEFPEHPVHCVDTQPALDCGIKNCVYILYNVHEIKSITNNNNIHKARL